MSNVSAGALASKRWVSATVISKGTAVADIGVGGEAGEQLKL